MTFKEKLQKEHPNCVSAEWCGGCCGCPEEYGYEPVGRYEKCVITDDGEEKCKNCWDREIPGTEPKTAREAADAAEHENLRSAAQNRVFHRVGKAEGYLMIAKAVALRSTCIRRQYGAVIVRDDCIIATGYNGAARGEPNCCDVGECWREAHGVPHGEQYEKCVAVHAEDNAISQAGRETIGADLYLVGFENGAEIDAEPCMMCARKIKNARIARVITRKGIIYENGQN